MFALKSVQFLADLAHTSPELFDPMTARDLDNVGTRLMQRLAPNQRPVSADDMAFDRIAGSLEEN